MPLSVRTAGQSAVRLLDGALLAWVAIWLSVAIATGVTLWEVSDLGDTVTSSGEAITSAGSALEALDGVPLIGDRPAELGREAVATGEEIARSGSSVRGELRRLALLLGLAIAFVPTTPVVGLYVPLRLARRREQRAIARSLRDHPDEPGLDRWLAQRALDHLSWSEARRVEPDPWQALGEGRTRALADAELSRIGLHRRG